MNKSITDRYDVYITDLKLIGWVVDLYGDNIVTMIRDGYNLSMWINISTNKIEFSIESKGIYNRKGDIIRNKTDYIGERKFDEYFRHEIREKKLEELL